jgi:hypothetical protein
MDVQGALGLSDNYCNGFEQIRVSFRVKDEAPEEKLREVVARAQLRSAVFDIPTCLGSASRRGASTLQGLVTPWTLRSKPDANGGTLLLVGAT